MNDLEPNYDFSETGYPIKEPVLYFALSLRQPNKIRLINVGPELVRCILERLQSFITVQASGYVIFKDYMQTSFTGRFNIYDILLTKDYFQKPEEGGEVLKQDDATLIRVAFCRIFGTLFCYGYDISVASDLARDELIHTTLFFRLRDPQHDFIPLHFYSHKFICIAPYANDTILLINIPKVALEPMLKIIHLTWSPGIKSKQTLADDDRSVSVVVSLKLSGSPWKQAVFNSGKVTIQGRLIILEVTRILAGHKWRLATNINFSGTTDTFFYQWCPNLELEEDRYCALILSRYERLRLLHVPTNLVPVIRECADKFWYLHVNKVKEYHGTTELKLGGCPWWADGTDAVEARYFISSLIGTLKANGWEVSGTIDLSRHNNDKTTFLLRQCAQQFTPHMCIGFNRANRIRLIVGSSEISEEAELKLTSRMNEVIKQRWVALGPRNYGKSVEWKLEGDPWDTEGLYSDHTRGIFLLCLLLEAVQPLGWRLVASADISSKNLDANERVSLVGKPEDMHTWFFLYDSMLCHQPSFATSHDNDVLPDPDKHHHHHHHHHHLQNFAPPLPSHQQHPLFPDQGGGRPVHSDLTGSVSVPNLDAENAAASSPVHPDSNIRYMTQSHTDRRPPCYALNHQFAAGPGPSQGGPGYPQHRQQQPSGASATATPCHAHHAPHPHPPVCPDGTLKAHQRSRSVPSVAPTSCTPTGHLKGDASYLMGTSMFAADGSTAFPGYHANGVVCGAAAHAMSNLSAFGAIHHQPHCGRRAGLVRQASAGSIPPELHSASCYAAAFAAADHQHLHHGHHHHGHHGLVWTAAPQDLDTGYKSDGEGCYRGGTLASDFSSAFRQHRPFRSHLTSGNGMPIQHDAHYMASSGARNGYVSDGEGYLLQSQENKRVTRSGKFGGSHGDSSRFGSHDHPSDGADDAHGRGPHDARDEDMDEDEDDDEDDEDDEEEEEDDEEDEEDGRQEAHKAMTSAARAAALASAVAAVAEAAAAASVRNMDESGDLVVGYSTFRAEAAVAASRSTSSREMNLAKTSANTPGTTSDSCEELYPGGGQTSAGRCDTNCSSRRGSRSSSRQELPPDSCMSCSRRNSSRQGNAVDDARGARSRASSNAGSTQGNSQGHGHDDYCSENSNESMPRGQPSTSMAARDHGASSAVSSGDALSQAGCAMGMCATMINPKNADGRRGFACQPASGSCQIMIQPSKPGGRNGQTECQDFHMKQEASCSTSRSMNSFIRQESSTSFQSGQSATSTRSAPSCPGVTNPNSRRQNRPPYCLQQTHGFANLAAHPMMPAGHARSDHVLAPCHGNNGGILMEGKMCSGSGRISGPGGQAHMHGNVESCSTQSSSSSASVPADYATCSSVVPSAFPSYDPGGAGFGHLHAHHTHLVAAPAAAHHHQQQQQQHRRKAHRDQSDHQRGHSASRLLQSSRSSSVGKRAAASSSASAPQDVRANDYYYVGEFYG